MKEFFKVYNIEQIQEVFLDKEYDLASKFVNAYNPTHVWGEHDQIIYFLFRAYTKLDAITIQNLHSKLTPVLQNKIIDYLREYSCNYDTNKETVKKCNQIIVMLGNPEKGINEILIMLEGFIDFPLFLDLNKIIEKAKQSIPSHLARVFSSLYLLLKETKEIYSPETRPKPWVALDNVEKYYIQELIHEFEKVFQYIIFGYFSQGTLF